MGAYGADGGIENPMIVIAILTILAAVATYARVQERKIETYEREDGRK